ncbi:hypothetical protein CN198_14160 [Sinorhizobium meliloti]|uniref:hypothetical protein n=1 Tax=Rhizobium meliloti TaxID=382 RepID=UPI000FDCD21D|nr:hypothetical protein [Sinorhizobium meliloti]RVH69202.1 hypothetical protein CN198_14160 [Sinorhizobium meliloti]
MSKTSNEAAGGLLFVGLIAAAVYVVGSNPVVTGIFGMAKANREWQAEGAKASHERHYQFVCAIYRDASAMEKLTDPHMREISWCEDYLDRLPPKESS